MNERLEQGQRAAGPFEIMTWTRAALEKRLKHRKRLTKIDALSEFDRAVAEVVTAELSRLQEAQEAGGSRTRPIFPDGGFAKAWRGQVELHPPAGPLEVEPPFDQNAGKGGAVPATAAITQEEKMPQ